MLPRVTIAGREYSTYWIVFLCRILLMLVLNLWKNAGKGGHGRENKYGSLTFSRRIVLTMLVILYSLLGAKLLYYAENIRVLAEQGAGLDGVSFFGSVFLVPAAMLGTCCLAKLDYRITMDFLSPSLMLMLAALRIGCFLSGCCGGIACTIAGFRIAKFPTQLTECVCDLLIMCGLLLYDRFWHNRGRLYPFIMVYYGCLRFLLEFVRDTPKDWLGFSHGQWFAVISVIVGGYWLYSLGKKDKKVRPAPRRK